MVGDVRMFGVDIEPPLLIYIPLVRRYASSVLVRTVPGAAYLNAAIRTEARGVAPAAPLPEIQTLDDRFSDEIAKPRFYLFLLGAFATTGLTLAGIGVYDVMSYAVARRSHEFGIRMALGAECAEILRLVLMDATKRVSAGAAIGLAGALAATRLSASLLYGVKPGDPATLLGVLAILMGVALAASILAARRATCVDPNQALRCA